MAGNNVIAQLVKMMERIQTRMEVSEKKMKMRLVALQKLTKEP